MKSLFKAIAFIPHAWEEKDLRGLQPLWRGENARERGDNLLEVGERIMGEGIWTYEGSLRQIILVSAFEIFLVGYCIYYLLDDVTISW